MLNRPSMHSISTQNGHSYICFCLLICLFNLITITLGMTTFVWLCQYLWKSTQKKTTRRAIFLFFSYNASIEQTWDNYKKTNQLDLQRLRLNEDIYFSIELDQFSLVEQLTLKNTKRCYQLLRSPQSNSMYLSTMFFGSIKAGGSFEKDQLFNSFVSSVFNFKASLFVLAELQMDGSVGVLFHNWRCIQFAKQNSRRFINGHGLNSVFSGELLKLSSGLPN